MALTLVHPAERPSSRWTWESARGCTRAVRVSPHVHALLVTLSLWREDRVVGSLRLTPAEVSELISELTAALADLAIPRAAVQAAGPEDLRARGTSVEARLAAEPTDGD